MYTALVILDGNVIFTTKVIASVEKYENARMQFVQCLPCHVATRGERQPRPTSYDPCCSCALPGGKVWGGVWGGEGGLGGRCGVGLRGGACASGGDGAGAGRVAPWSGAGAVGRRRSVWGGVYRRWGWVGRGGRYVCGRGRHCACRRQRGGVHLEMLHSDAAQRLDA